MSHRLVRGAVLGLLLGVGACNQILGIQERTLSDATAGGGPSEAGAPAGGAGSTECLPNASPIRTGVVQVDGLLDASDALIVAFLDIEKDFHSRIEVTAHALGLNTTAGYTSEMVDDLIAALQEDVATSSANGLAVYIGEVECAADSERALEQQNHCEEAAGCDTAVASSETECDGICVGECAGECDTCASASAASCAGACLGECSPPEALSCAGLCRGTCDGACTEEDVSGCAGGCDGNCGGTCQFFQAASCAGVCDGECREFSNTECPTDATCAGHCQGVCSGACLGRPIPIPGDLACDFAEVCSLQASLLGAARMTCGVPKVTSAFETSAAVGAAAAAQFKARIDGMIVTTPQLLVDLVKLEVMAVGQIDQLQVSPTPAYPTLLSALRDISTRAQQGQPIHGVRAGCEGEVGPFVAPTVETLDALYARGIDLAGDELKFITALRGGFH